MKKTLPNRIKSTRTRVKPKTVSRLVKELDALFSRFIRLSFVDNEGNVKCYTCSYKAPLKKMQAGHFVSRFYKETRWNEDNVRPQCLTEDSFLRTHDGSEKSIKDIQVGDKLQCFDEINFDKKIGLVECVETFMPDDLYEVELMNGEKFCATSDHKVVANGQWFEIKEMLHNVTAYNILEI